MTPGERRAQIDRRFESTLSVFDERIAQEQGAIAGQRRGGRTGSGGAAGMGDDLGGDGASGDGSDGSDAGGEGNGQSGQGQGDQGGWSGGSPGGGDVRTAGTGGARGGGGGVGGGAGGGSGPNTVPADIPDGRDDDIVARQLREAAMQEKDPELREKLWEEYRNYKKSTS